MVNRLIVHVDMDAFYASVEEADHPEYRGRPLIVGADPKGGQGRGVVAASSYAARVFGVRSAMPVSRAYRLCPGGIFVKPRMERYIEVSRQVFAIFRRYTDLVEGLSLDEAFLDVTGSALLFGDAPTIARRIKEEIKRETGLVCSVGVAPSKFVAKIASDIKKPDGFVVVEAGETLAFLWPLPVTRLWGVGEKTAEALWRRGLRTIGDVAALSQSDARAMLGEHGLQLLALARGEDEREVVPDQAAKSVGAETTFDEDTADRETLERTLLALADRVAARLRREGVLATGVTLKFRDESFHTVTRALTLNEPTDVTGNLYRAGLALLERTGWHGERKVRLVGLTGHKLEKEWNPQADLFGEAKRSEKERRAEEAVDRIREKFGRAALKRAALIK